MTMALQHMTFGSSSKEASHPPENPETHKLHSYPLFDWLRFVLASVVVLGHANFQFLPFLNGSLAVSVFFALSGWLIGGILLRTDIAELPRFFFNRATRIWITYGAAIVLLYGVAALREGVDVFWWKYLVMDVTFTHQLFTFFPAASLEMPLDGSGNQFWSLSVEEQFYLVTPLLMLFLPHGKTLIFWIVFTLLALSFSTHAGPIALGVCAAILQRDHDLENRPWVRLVALVVVIGCALALSFGKKDLAWLASAFFSIGVVIALAIPGRRSKIALFLGALSFPLYLNHWLGLSLTHGIAKHTGFLEMAALPFLSYAVAIGITIPIYLLVDRNVMAQRAKWYGPKLGRRLGQMAYALVGIGLLLGLLFHEFGPHAIVPPEAQGMAG